MILIAKQKARGQRQRKGVSHVSNGNTLNGTITANEGCDCTPDAPLSNCVKSDADIFCITKCNEARQSKGGVSANEQPQFVMGEGIMRLTTPAPSGPLILSAATARPPAKAKENGGSYDVQNGMTGGRGMVGGFFKPGQNTGVVGPRQATVPAPKSSNAVRNVAISLGAIALGVAAVSAASDSKKKRRRDE